MLTKDELLVDGETFIADYNVEIARWKDRRWSSTVPPLYVILTDQRMILQPHARKRREPAIIPTRYITGVAAIVNPRHGLVIYLKNNYQLGMFVAGGAQQDMLNKLHELRDPKYRQQTQYEIALEQTYLQKLIQYFEQLSPQMS